MDRKVCGTSSPEKARSVSCTNSIFPYLVRDALGQAESVPHGFYRSLHYGDDVASYTTLFPSE